MTHKTGAAQRIKDIQRSDGAIPWMEDGPLDPWNHIEAAMALAISGYAQEAEQAYHFLTHTQCLDGSWYGDYGNAVPMADYVHLSREEAPQVRDTNFTAYIATGVWHHYLATNNTTFLQRTWPMVEHAISHVLSLQQTGGEIIWCAEARPIQDHDALLSANASIYKSLECAISIACKIQKHVPHWDKARHLLGHALRYTPDNFQRTQQNPQSFSMDWYYPVLSGLLAGDEARQHLTTQWAQFVVEGLGCRCVADQPWITVAESCELALALISCGESAQAKEVLSWQQQWQDKSGAYWMGYQLEEKIIWPEERPAWTSAAFLLAVDALSPHSATARLFRHPTAPSAAHIATEHLATA